MPLRLHACFGVRARRSCVRQFLVVFERHVRQLTLRLAQHVCRRFVLSAERCMLWYCLRFGRRWSVLLHIYLSNCGQEAAMLSVVISLQTAAQKAILARSHDVQPSESAGHVFLFVNTVRSSHLAAQVNNGPCWRTWNCLLPNCAHLTSLAVLRLHINWLMRECMRAH